MLGIIFLILLGMGIFAINPFLGWAYIILIIIGMFNS